MENSKIKLNTNKRPFVMLYHDFIRCKLLNWNEKDLYIILLMYVEKNSKQCFPSISELCNISGKSKNTVLKAINGLEEKRILKKETRVTKKGQTSNLYTLYDIDTIWKSENIEELETVVDKIEEKCMIEALTAKGYTVTKDKEPTSIPTKVEDVSPQYQNDIPIYTTKIPESQVPEVPEDLERYTMDDIRQILDYDIMVHDHPHQQQDIDSVMDILYTALNTTKPTIRIAGEDKPSMVVIGKLMKLNYESIMYAIKKFSKQTERINNPVSYMLTMLYNAPEQFRLDIQNQASHDMSHWNTLKLNTAGNGFRPQVVDNIPESQFYQSDNVFSKEVDQWGEEKHHQSTDENRTKQGSQENQQESHTRRFMPV